jgi:hypothetical protein
VSASSSDPGEAGITDTCSTTAGNYSITFTGSAGTKTAYAWYKDTAGNYSVQTANITYDTDTPSLSNVKASDIRTNGFDLTWTSSEAGTTHVGVTRWVDDDHHEFVNTYKDADGKVMMEQVGKAKRRK